MEHMECITISWRIEKEFATGNVLDKRHEIEDMLDVALKEYGVGLCDGGGSGFGQMDIYCYVDDVDIGREIIERVIAESEMPGAIVVML